ncbi:MAG: D-glycero-beta-D-manno-heptose-7-phosphate kinase [Gemmatimonadales bacterium]|nr:D-glycero-beta-D-manno-heptose-7-phosphate kinase [Gemmatimonadales bacterium]
MSPNFKQIIDNFTGRRLAVVGDSMLDRFLWGRVDRISPEAPVPVVRLEKETTKLGGAANVAANIRALGAEVTLFGVWGADAEGLRMRELLVERGIEPQGMITDEGRPTTIKTRIIAHNQQVVRTDREQDGPVCADVIDRLVSGWQSAAGQFDGIIISDYGKGVLSRSVLEGLIKFGCREGIPVVVDPKKGNFSQYTGATSLTPNQKEAEQACATQIVDEETLSEVGGTILRRTRAEAVLVTRGEHGMALFQKEGPEHHLPTRATMVYDVTGAGDTVIAVYTTALATGADFPAAAALANYAAGIAVRELGTAEVKAAQLVELLAEQGDS